MEPARFGYTIFYVVDVDLTLDFFSNSFGVARGFQSPEGDYGELQTGTTTLAFAANSVAESDFEKTGGYQRLDSASPPMGASITFLTPDVPGILAQAVAAGGTRLIDPVNKPWGQTVAYARDPNGILIEIATPVQR